MQPTAPFEDSKWPCHAAEAFLELLYASVSSTREEVVLAHPFPDRGSNRIDLEENVGPQLSLLVIEVTGQVVRAAVPANDERAADDFAFEAGDGEATDGPPRSTRA